MGKSIKYLFLIYFATILASCSPERKLAAKFVRDLKPGAVLLLAPDVVFKNSYKVPDIDNFESLPQEAQDSALLNNSLLVQYCDDSLYIKAFMDALSKGFQSYGFSVNYNQPVNQFPDAGKSSFIINIAQLQIEEYFDSISDETSFDLESTNIFDFYITALNLNQWMELSEVNREQKEPDLIFTTRKITDEFHGNFMYYLMSGDIEYEYSIDSLTVDKVYYFARKLGQLHANWIIDYLMNESIRNNMPEGRLPGKLFTYDPREKAIRRTNSLPVTRMQ
ncbi:MAG: hypothetical protein WCQ70_06460 [Lentimicrobiaceae bacterium]